MSAPPTGGFAVCADKQTHAPTTRTYMFMCEIERDERVRVCCVCVVVVSVVTARHSSDSRAKGAKAPKPHPLCTQYRAQVGHHRLGRRSRCVAEGNLSTAIHNKPAVHTTIEEIGMDTFRAYSL